MDRMPTREEVYEAWCLVKDLEEQLANARIAHLKLAYARHPDVKDKNRRDRAYMLGGSDGTEE